MIIPKILRKASSSHSSSHHSHRSSSSSSQARRDHTPSQPSSSTNTPSHSLTNTPNASQTHLNGSGFNTPDFHHHHQASHRQGSIGHSHGHGHSSSSVAAAPLAPSFQPYEMVQAQQVVEGLISGSLVVLFTKSNDQASQTLKSLLLSHNIFFQLFEVDTAPDNMGPVVEYYLDERAISQGYARPYRSATSSSIGGSGSGYFASPPTPGGSPSISSVSMQGQNNAPSTPGDNKKYGLFHSNHHSVFDPQMFIKGTHVGGIDQVVQLERSGQLARMFEVK